MKKLFTYIQRLITSIWLLFAKEKEVKETSSLLPLNLQFFAEGGDGGDGKGGSSGEGAGNGNGEGGNGEEPFAVFKTKDDLNKRLSRAEKKGQKELAQQLGYDSVEEMLEVLGKKNEPKNNNNQPKGSDPQPVDINKLVEDKLKEERQKTFKRILTSEVKVVANELGFADWEDALKLADLSEVKEDDNGNITGVKEALEALAKKKPHLIKQQGNGTFGATIPNNPGGAGGKKNLEEIKKMAQNRGVQQTTAYNPWA